MRRGRSHSPSRLLNNSLNNPLEHLEQRTLFAAPVITTSLGLSEFTEDGIPLPVDPGVVVVDADSLIVRATARISANYNPAEDSLSVPDLPGLAAAWNALTATLTITGSASHSVYTAALRAVAYHNSSDNPVDVARTITFTASDASSTSLPRSRSVLVTPMPDAPVVASSGDAAQFTPGDHPVAIDPAIALSDVDSADMWSAVLQITGNYLPGEDSLLFDDQLGINAFWDEPSGTLLLVGMAPIADYQAALRSVRFSTSSDDTATRTITLDVSDGALPSAPVTINVDVLPANMPPDLVASGMTAYYAENAAPVAIDPLISLSDDEGAIVSATITLGVGYRADQDMLVLTSDLGIDAAWDAATGTLTLTGPASAADMEAALRAVAYVNTSDDPADDLRLVRIVARDADGAESETWQTLYVLPVNDAPTVAPSGGGASFTQGQAAVPIDPNVILDDIDTPTLASAVVRIAVGFQPGADTLIFSPQGSISASWDAAAGALTLSGVASVAAYQAALRSVQFSNNAANPSTAARSLSIQVVDSAGASSTAASRNLSVTATPTPPADHPGCKHHHKCCKIVANPPRNPCTAIKIILKHKHRHDCDHDHRHADTHHNRKHDIQDRGGLGKRKC